MRPLHVYIPLRPFRPYICPRTSTPLYLYMFVRSYPYTRFHTSTPIYLYMITYFHAHVRTTNIYSHFQSLTLYTCLEYMYAHILAIHVSILSRHYMLNTCLQTSKLRYALYMFTYLYIHGL
jgi:hypothetical protein